MLGRCPRPRRGGGSSPNPASCGCCKTAISSSAPRLQRKRKHAAPGLAGFAVRPVRMRTGENSGDFRKNERARFSEIPAVFLLPGNSLVDAESSRRILLIFSSVQHRQGWSRDEPQATASGGCFACGEINRNKQSPLWGVAPIEVADRWSLVQGPGG